jgi:signal recognition particle receptor subunit beta
VEGAVQLDFAARELLLKLVYYGPALSGKTTNLQALHAVSDKDAAGRLMTLETKDDRTLFFDLLPLTFRGKGDLSVRIKVFTVPGQVIHASTRRLVVQGADGIVFVADSQLDQTENNGASFLDLRNNLKINGIQLKEMPVAIQFNKRDLPNVRSDEELVELAARGREPVYLGVASDGRGVVETFLGVLQLTSNKLDEKHALKQKFGLEGATLIDHIARKLGVEAGASTAISSCLGGTSQFQRCQVG